jgi:hypothetical protein
MSGINKIGFGWSSTLILGGAGPFVPTEILFGGALGGFAQSTGLVWDETTLGGLSTTITWNAGGTTFNGLKLNVVNTASAAASRLLSLQLSSVPKFTVDVGGDTWVATRIGVNGVVDTDYEVKATKATVAGTSHIGAVSTNANSRAAISAVTDSGNLLTMRSFGSTWAAADFFGLTLVNGGVLASNGSGDLAIGTVGAGNLKFATTNVVRATVTDGGNFLLGTSTNVASSQLRILATKSITAAAGSIWNGVDVMAATATLTGGATPVTRLGFVNIEIPTIIAATPTVVVAAATLYLPGAPLGGGAGPVVITQPNTLHIATGNAQFGGYVGIGAYPNVDLLLQKTTAGGSVTALVNNLSTTGFGLVAVSGDTASTSFKTFGSAYVASTVFAETIVSGSALVQTSGLGTMAIGTQAAAPLKLGTNDLTRVIITPGATAAEGGNVLIGTTTEITSSRLKVKADHTIASGAGAVYKGILFEADAVTVSGNTGITTATGFNKFCIEAPGFTTAAAISSSATCYISGPPTIIAGGGSIGSPYTLNIGTGSTRFGGRILASQAVNINAADTITIGDGNSALITGAHNIKWFTSAGWTPGSWVVFTFDNICNISHNDGGGAVGTVPFFFPAGALVTTEAGEVHLFLVTATSLLCVV